MQVIYHWAFAVALALCPRAPTLKSGEGARAHTVYMALAPLHVTDFRPWLSYAPCSHAAAAYPRYSVLLSVLDVFHVLGMLE